jgi:hypothetical protein
MSITKNTRLKFETNFITDDTDAMKKGTQGRRALETPINKGQKQHVCDFGETQKIQLARKPRRRSTIADEMRLFFVSVASVAFSHQKAGNASDANRKTAQTCNTKKRKQNVGRHFGTFRHISPHLLTRRARGRTEWILWHILTKDFKFETCQNLSITVKEQ